MGRIVNDLESVNVCYFLDAFCVARGAIDVYGHDGGRMRCDGGFNFFGIYISGFFVDIDKHGLESVPPNGMSRRDKAVWSRDDFAGDAHGLQCRNKWKCSVGEQAEVLNA